mgnify:CR=1 FL=1
MIFAWRYRRAVREADAMASLTGMKYYVILMGGRLKAVPKRNIKALIRTRRFRKGVRIEDIEKRELYITK